MSYYPDEYRDVSLADIEDELKQLRESLGYRSDERVEQLKGVLLILGRMEQTLASLSAKAGGGGEWSMIIAIILGFILWRVW